MLSLFSKSKNPPAATSSKEVPSPQFPSASQPPQAQAQSPSQPPSSTSQSSQSQSSDPAEQQQPPQTLLQYLTNQRSRRQLSLFFLGATALTLSSVFTRSSLVARYRIVQPRFYQQSNQGVEYAVNGPLEAFQALQIATLTVGSSAVMIGGGLLWAFDISSVNDLRARIRNAMGVRHVAKSEREIEAELEAWIAGELRSRREAKEKKEREGE